MWSLISSNKILERKMKEQAHLKHLTNLRNVKSKINNSSPRNFSFLSTRPKAQQLRKQRNYLIQNNNTILVQKMLSAHSTRRKEPVRTIDSLNISYNKRKQREIDIDNQILVKMLQGAQSKYPCQQILKQTSKYLKIRQNITNSRVAPFYDLQVSKKLLDSTLRPSSAKK